MRVKTPQQAEKILTAAARLFATHRFHEARMDDIAALAEVGKGTLYRYFKDKEELYLALLDRAAEGLQSRLCQVLCRTASPRQQLVAVVEGLIDYFDAEPHVFDLIQHAEAMQRPGAEFPWQKTRNKTMALVKDILRAGQRAGAVREADPDLAMLMLLGGLRAIIRFGKHPRPAGLAEEVVGQFLDGFGRADRPSVVDSPSSALHNA
ncbi:MAG: TetR/AcrR family transcriptional regulator [Gemmataceae bacterium]